MFRKEINTEQRFGRIKFIKCYPEVHESTPLQLDMNNPTGDTDGARFTYYSGAQKNIRGLRRVCVFSFMCYVLPSVDFLFFCLSFRPNWCLFFIFTFRMICCCIFFQLAVIRPYTINHNSGKQMTSFEYRIVF